MWRNIIFQVSYQPSLLVFILRRGPDIFLCEDGSRRHFTLIFNAFLLCKVFNEFNDQYIGDKFDTFRLLYRYTAFLEVVFFAIMIQWAIVNFGGDFTQTAPLTGEEWYAMVLLGLISVIVGFMMKQIPVSEDTEYFAGIVPKKGDDEMSK